MSDLPSTRTSTHPSEQRENPILDQGYRIPFDRIEADHVVPGIRTVIAQTEDGIASLSESDETPTWENTIVRFDDLTRRVRRATTPVQHLLGVRETPELREAWREILPEVSAFWSRLYLHEGLWARMRSYGETPEAAQLESLEARHLHKTLRDFQRAGADLPARDRARLEAIEVELSRLEQEFSENVLDATAGYTLHIEDPERLEGIPSDAMARFRARAEADGREGWTLTLDAPSFLAVMKHAHDRELRRELHGAYLARGTEGDLDNRPLIPRILELRSEKAKLLGFDNYPDYRLEEQMAQSGDRARAFIDEMIERTRPYWRRDLAEFEAAATEREMGDLHPWDTGYLMEQMRKARFDLDEEELRPYFPIEGVVEGLFALAKRLFGLTIKAREIDEIWHEDVRFYEIRDDGGVHLGSFYADFFPRREKRQGAWMADFAYGIPPEVAVERGVDPAPHLGNICANFPPPDGDTPALLSHRDVETLFHEFGHLLHHCVSRVPIEGRGGINVAWDWVELPSQLLENWCWEREALTLFARHWESGEPLPADLHERMLKARRFMGGWMQMRQLSFGTLDQALHTEYDPENDGDPVAWVTERLVELSPNREFAASHPLPAFLHLFSGGYAASYYAYLWSEVLEADLFTRFQDEGVFNSEVGREYVDQILSQGDRYDPDVLFRRFMGRDPDPEALIRRNLGSTD
ncbi:MAG: M3 family peptidase [Gemmatimonadales bacterium]|nr:MAG: M3 family peptidase [Gemmatimonadales bacterium]